MNTMTQTNDHRMSLFDLARWRVEDLLYVRHVESAEGSGFAVFAADGTYLDVVETMEEVLISAHQHEMEVASIH
jgi:hypothetical protein